MKRIILSLGALAIVFGMASSPLLAAPGRGSHGSARGAHAHAGRAGHAPVRGARYHGLHHGPGGYLLRDYRGWSRYYWNARYRCNFYFCPQANCYYYWYAPDACYLPVSQIATAPPTVAVVNNVNVNVNTIDPSAASPPMQVAPPSMP